MTAKKYICQKDRFLFIENMFSKLDGLSVDEIVRLRIDLKPHGRHLLGLCPFHNDTHFGSLVVTPDMGIWKCFSCGNGGNGIKFISLYDHLSYLEAAFQVALETNIISSDEYSLYAEEMKYSKECAAKIEKKHHTAPRHKGTPSNMASAAICHNVYRAIKDSCTLSEAHAAHLKNIRRLSDERIRSDYFSFPTSVTEQNTIIKHIRELYPDYTDELLMTVPGFFFDKKRKKISFYSAAGIGMLIHDAFGHIAAIQIRRDVIKEGQQRYAWFSSSFAPYKPDLYLGGAGCGAPRDVLYPDNTDRSILCITEGRFKSEVICAAGNVAISLQGVGSWRNIDKDIIEIMDTRPVTCIYLMFDADMFGKTQVFDQLHALTDMLLSVFPFIKIKCACWHEADGKGIDDLYHSGKISTIQYLDADSFIQQYLRVLTRVLTDFGYKSVSKIPKERKKEFIIALQKTEEDEILSSHHY